MSYEAELRVIAKNRRDGNFDKSLAWKAAEEIAELKERLNLKCEWKLHEDCNNDFDTECGSDMSYYGTPTENGFNWCPFCGHKIIYKY